MIPAGAPRAAGGRRRRARSGAGWRRRGCDPGPRRTRERSEIARIHPIHRTGRRLGRQAREGVESGPAPLGHHEEGHGHLLERVRADANVVLGPPASRCGGVAGRRAVRAASTPACTRSRLGAARCRVRRGRGSVLLCGRVRPLHKRSLGEPPPDNPVALRTPRCDGWPQRSLAEPIARQGQATRLPKEVGGLSPAGSSGVLGLRVRDV